jgi:hypothetical protein
MGRKTGSNISTGKRYSSWDECGKIRQQNYKPLLVIRVPPCMCMEEDEHVDKVVRKVEMSPSIIRFRLDMCIDMTATNPCPGTFKQQPLVVNLGVLPALHDSFSLFSIMASAIGHLISYSRNLMRRITVVMNSRRNHQLKNTAGVGSRLRRARGTHIIFFLFLFNLRYPTLLPHFNEARGMHIISTPSPARRELLRRRWTELWDNSRMNSESATRNYNPPHDSHYLEMW